MYGCEYYNELCYKDPLCSMGVMWLYYHDVMMLYELALCRVITVNTIMSCDIMLHHAVCFHVIMMLCLEWIFNCKYCIELSIIKSHKKYVFF